ncbi:MAG: endonuclease III [Bacilli bacterium]|nr:endonuclease III [Bacilli bacterium]
MNKIENYLDELIPDPKCELNYSKDYELLLATMLSAQTTDKRVNMVTDILFSKYPSVEALSKADLDDVINIIRPVGTFNKKASNVIEIAKSLLENYGGVVPNNRDYLESLPGVGRKTTNVVLSNLFDVPCIAVDTHVSRVSVRLGLAKDGDDPYTIEKKISRKFQKNELCRRHHQLVLFGRYYCTARNPKCGNCELKDICKYYKKLDK